MRLLIILAALALAACQTLDGPSQPTVETARGQQVLNAITVLGCTRAKTADARISRCTRLIDNAEKTATEKVSGDQLRVVGHVLRGLGYVDKREDGRALDDFNSAISLDAGHAQAYLARSTVWELRGDHAKMMRDLNTVVDLAPDRAEHYLARAAGWIVSEFPPERDEGPATTPAELRAIENATEDIEKAQAFDPELSDTYLLLGDINFELADFDTAIGYYSEAISRDRNDGSAYGNRATAYYRIEDYGSAIADFESAIRLDPDDASNYLKLGWILAAGPEGDLRDGDRAISLALEAERRASGEKPAALLFLLPTAYAESGRFDEAVRELERVLDFLRESAVQSNEDDTLRLLGLYVSAEELLEMFRNRKPFRFAETGQES
ncbi:MAG: tetratricopeptide repeat protein [Alphaproteobacteria bacterium]|nr:tetratricopeptide repeat protein [Alphaproteobacteria bacterium]